MSQSSAHASRQVRRLCQQCHGRRALFQYRGEVRADRHHTLCFACYRAERDRMRAAALAARVAALEVFPAPAAQLRAPTSAQTGHRRRMPAHLAAQATGRLR